MEEHQPYARTKHPDEQNQKLRQQREQEKADFAWLVGDARGRRFIWRLLSITGIFRSSFSGDSNRTFFQEGERNIGLQVMRDINEVCPEKMAEMIREAKQDDGSSSN